MLRKRTWHIIELTVGRTSDGGKDGAVEPTRLHFAGPFDSKEQAVRHCPDNHEKPEGLVDYIVVDFDNDRDFDRYIFGR